MFKTKLTFGLFFVRLKYIFKHFVLNCRYYKKCRPIKAKKKNILYFVFDPKAKHPGLADRLKAIISLYNIAKSNNYGFKFYYETPFSLADYIKPKKDWRIGLDDLEYSLSDTKIINERDYWRVEHLTPNKQYHCYQYTGNDMPWEFPQTGYKWHELFAELFEPSDILQQELDSLNLPKVPYIAVQLRFVNALEHFENTFFDNYLEREEDRIALIRKCKNGIQEIIDDNPSVPVYVFSDSKVFLDSLSDMPVHVLEHDSIGHTGNSKMTSVHLKTFVDLFVMADAQSIYRIKAKELYNLSCFALLASRIGNVKFIDKEL